jgi:uncharacterized protein (TIGR02996 family)
MRRFEYRDEKSSKFWSIDLQGSRFTIHFGKIGTAGQTQLKEFPDDTKAQKEYDKLIAEKTGKGYVETTPKDALPVGPAGPLREALEQAIVANPDDLANHRAYADYLMEQGDPRGEFIQVQLALEDPGHKGNRKALQKREKELLDAHVRTWLGGLAPCFLSSPEDEPEEELAESFANYEPGPPNYQFQFARGWLDTLRLDDLTSILAERLLDCPLARIVRRLTIIHNGYDDPGLADLARAPIFGNVRYFQFGPDDDQCHTNGEEVIPLIAQMPRLEELHLYAHNVPTKALFTLPFPHLRRLTLNHIYEYPFEILAKNSTLTNLEYLFCWPHALEPDDEAAYITPANAQALIRAPNLTGLRHLALYLSDLGDEGCAALVESGLLGRLEVLDLWNGRITDAGARLLAASPDLKRLQRLRLSGNALTPAGIAALRATGLEKLEAENQHSEENRAEDYLWEGDPE